MYLPTIIIYIVIFYLIKNLYDKLKKRSTSEILKDVDGPFPLPIIGNAYQFISGGSPHLNLDKYMKKYDGIARFWIGDRYFIYVSKVELVKEMLITRQHEFRDRPYQGPPSWDFITSKRKGLINANGQKWLELYPLIIKNLRRSTLSNKDSLYLDNIDCFLLNNLAKYSETGEVCYTRDYIKECVTSIYFRYMFNDDFEENSKNLSREINEVAENLFFTGIFDYLKAFDKIYYMYLEKTKKLFTKCRTIFEKKVVDHLKTIDPEKPRDFLDMMLIDLKYVNSKDADIVHITQICIDIFLASVGVSSDSIHWVVLQLCNHQEEQEKIYQELKKISKNGKVTNENKTEAPYTFGFLKEVIRLNTTVFGIPRTNLEDTNLGDYFIPKDTILLVNYHALGEDETIYNNPLKIDPNRYLNGDPPTLYHFGMGVRGCVGKSIAYEQMFLIIANLLLKYKIRPVGDKKIDDTEVFAVTLKPRNFGCLVESRN